jgi:tRNA threonylcarbamoyladenosine biosynthesis protein TsaB
MAGVSVVPAGTGEAGDLEGWATGWRAENGRGRVYDRHSRLSPVLILSLDTTTRAGSAALLEDDLVRAVAAGDAARTHGERLPGELARLLREAGVALGAVDLLAVASGPGAFTGLRIGLAAMQGLAMTLDRPVIGIPALEAIAVAACETIGMDRARIGVWMDAARGEVFAERFDTERVPGDITRLTPIAPPEVGTAEAIWSRWIADGVACAAIIGDGAERYAATVAPRIPVLPHPLLAPAVGRLARRRAADGGAHPPHQLQPLYVRRPDAERG